ncbi:MAG: leucyl aminopeptidase family protein [Candidatus Gracilibacteria bacterium]|nr:leucyl aminopeptidase family protein [Candidatus Gracilibacteria bacterium]
MIKIYENIKTIKQSNLFYFIESEECIEKLSILNLEKTLLDKITKTIKEKENTLLQFFLGGNNFESLFIAFYVNKDKSTLTEFLGENVTKLPNKFTILSNNKENLLSIVDNCLLSRYKFQQYLTEKKEDEINIVCEKEIRQKLDDRLETINNIIFARDLGETPTSDLYPELFVNKAKSLKFRKTKIKILTPRDIQKQGLGLLWAVGKGSINKPFMLVLERIVNRKYPTIGIVGKGIVFDTGGINLKPEQWLYLMKDDMSGAGTVLALMKELDRKNLNVNIVACIPLAENSISGEAYRPSDILKAYNGKTVNVINTDAEGRLILADGASYLSRNYKLDRVITVATLTGACLFAIGYRYAGVMGTDKEIIDKLLSYSKENFEKYHELPFEKYYIEKTKSKIADYDNLTEGIYAGATMGGAFIYNFLENNEKYTHIDIAGVANNSFEPYGLYTKTSTGFGVDSLSNLFLNM